MRSASCIAVGFASIVALAGVASAQLAGHNYLGDVGLEAGTQPPPGLYPSAAYTFYHTSKVRDDDGGASDLFGGGSLEINGWVPILTWVAEPRWLGAHYSVVAALPFVSQSLDAPALGLDLKSDFSVGDLYVRPINLGWHLYDAGSDPKAPAKRADLLAAFGVFAPTGRFDEGASDNVGLGMWSFELLGGASVFFGPNRRWRLATALAWETHTEREGGDEVGDILTLEGGFGYDVLGELLKVGVVYYAQWKLTRDDLGPFLGKATGKHEIFGVGPEVSGLLLLGERWRGLPNLAVSARYEFGLGGRSYTQGNTLFLLLTLLFPTGSSAAASAPDGDAGAEISRRRHLRRRDP